jgi:hypothetical protein
MATTPQADLQRAEKHAGEAERLLKGRGRDRAGRVSVGQAPSLTIRCACRTLQRPGLRGEPLPPLRQRKGGEKGESSCAKFEASAGAGVW